MDIKTGFEAATTVFLVSSILFLFGCTDLTRYRTGTTPQSGDCKPGDAKELCPIVLTGPDRAYSMSVVEFDDQGDLFSKQPVDLALAQINAPQADSDKYQGMLVVAFAHGWNHDAQAGDPNLVFFDAMLARMAAFEAAEAASDDRKPRRVCGVFLAWRGLSQRVPGLQLLTFWNRKDTAHRIGERGATEVLLKLGNAAYSARAQSDLHPNRYIVMGHSFGGAVVYSAMSQLIAMDFLQQQQGQAEHKRPLLADAVVLFNPAFEAARIQHLLETAGTLGPRRPTLSIFTSKSDWATGLAFPIARYFNTAALDYREAENPIKNGAGIGQRKANVQTPGHYNAYLTHDLVKAGDNSDCPVVSKNVLPTMPALIGASQAQKQDAGNQALDAMADLEDEYEAGRIMNFGLSCLVPRADLKFAQLSVINVSMDDTVWHNHDLVQSDDRVAIMLDFLEKFIPFAASPKALQEPLVAVQAVPGFAGAHPGRSKEGRRRPRSRF